MKNAPSEPPLSPRVKKRHFRRWALLFFLLLAAAFAAHRFLYEVPVLMYHRVTDAPEKSGLAVSAETFERQMEFLKTHRYRVISLAELAREQQAGRKLPAKTVCLTFDDGYLDNMKNAFPPLKKMKFPATVFMITSNIGKTDWLSEEDLRILDEGSVAIGSHTEHHAFLPALPPEAVRTELENSKAVLENVIGHPVTLFSYPAGGVTPEIESLVRQAGYEAAVTTNYAAPERDVFAIRRIKVGESSGNLFNFWFKVSGYYHLGKKRVRYAGAAVPLERAEAYA